MTTPRPLPQQPAPQKKRGCLRAFLIVVGLVFGLIIDLAIIGTLVHPSGSQSGSSVSQSNVPLAATPEERPISWREIDSMYNLRSKNTDLQKDEAWKHYKGKRVTWSGQVTSVSDGWTGLTLQVKMNPETFTSDLLIKLKKAEKSKAAQLHQGDQVR